MSSMETIKNKMEAYTQLTHRKRMECFKRPLYGLPWRNVEFLEQPVLLSL